MKRLLVIFLLFGCIHNVTAEQKLTRVGYARSIETSQLLYTEHHYEVFSDENLLESTVIYKDENGLAFAEKHVNFRTSVFLPEFSLINKVTGHRESTRYLDESYEVEFLERKDETLQKKPLAYSVDAIGDAGFDNFIIRHWDQIIAGERFKRDFLIPGMLRFFDFRIYQEEVVELSGNSYRVLHIEPASFLLRAFSGTSKLYYAYDEPVLKKFHGISNMRDSKGDNYKVTISYDSQESVLAVADTAY